MNLDRQAWAAKHQRFKELRRQKKQHWEDFLEDAGNIWSTTIYLQDHTLRPSFSPIPRIKTGPTLAATTNADIGTSLLENFFPPPLPYPPPTHSDYSNNSRSHAQIEDPPIQKEDVRAAIFKASPLKAPGQDNTPALVWQKLWPMLQDQIFLLFCESLRQGKLPKNWKLAKIIPLKKSGKADLTEPNAFRPISLLSNLSKAIESVVAERIAYLAEKFRLLPSNHYGALKRKSTIDALLTV